jgi:putative SOS response-associated peptidase YedK
MCGAYGFSVKDAKEVYDRFEVVNQLEDLKPRWNVRPGQMNPVITSASPNRISRMFWGLIPYWAKDEKSTWSTINARAETVESAASYRVPFRRRRCIVPATGFYEPDKINFAKPPFPWHYFKLKEQEVFGFAGLYDVWKDRQSGKEIYSYTIITTEPNEVVGEFHNRMPVILQREDEETWLNPDISEPAQLLPLLKSYPAEKMETWPVGDEARNVKNDYPEVMKPI